MKGNLIITTLVASMTAVPLLIGCNQEMEDEPLDGLEYETLAAGRKTRAADISGGNIMRVVAGERTLLLQDAIFTSEIKLSWNAGSLTRGNPPKIECKNFSLEPLDTNKYEVYRCDLEKKWAGSCHIDVTVDIWYTAKGAIGPDEEPLVNDPRILYDVLKDDIVVELEPDPMW